MSTRHSNEDVAIAFALVIGAGAATGLGAMVVFFPALVEHAKNKTLAAALGLSAGVMTYVSFVEIFQKSVQSFAVELGEKRAYSYATLCFFGGVVAMLALNHGVTALLGGHHHYHHNPMQEGKTRKTKENSQESGESNPNGNDTNANSSTLAPPCCSENPSRDLASIQHMAEEMADKQQQQHSGIDQGGDDEEEDEENGGNKNTDQHDQDKLMRMSINTALAIALHNFPEGLATFVATLNDTKVGAVLAVAIAIHNIPEGLCVAMPVYYATGVRWKAFAWGVLSGVSEPVAALLGWAVLANAVTDIVYAVLFGLVSGMMVIICARELLPTAHRYDPGDTVVTNSFICGMAIMALSLVLFVI